MTIPKEILQQHIAVLGKTGSGKTSTGKLAIEQVVADGARVCVLDPIKSDWWGLTSSESGKRAGLPFQILGGPHGHVPLHSSAGKAIADVVASGALPLSIIDMADFEPGGQAKFFVDFAPTLLRKMRGVVYLVIEEAHLFAPKERSGIGAENLSIHWAKTMATAGRSKGVRLVLVTQRTQALHNALLGSCDTLIAHRLTAPADQEPVVKWLKANTTKEVLEEVATSLASLKTGEGWICSGEARLFKRVHFPRISTYDNTATPTGDGQAHDVKTAAVDADKLRAIIGDAVEKAKADDPRELKKRIAELERQVKAGQIVPAGTNLPTKDKPALTDPDRELLKQLSADFREFVDAIADRADVTLNSIAARAKAEIDKACGEWIAGVDKRRKLFLEHLEKTRFRKILEKVDHAIPTAVHAARLQRPLANPGRVGNDNGRPHIQRSPVSEGRGDAHVRGRVDAARPADANGYLPPGEKATLIAAAQYPNGITREQASILTGYKRSSRDAYIQRLLAKDYVEIRGGNVVATQAGVDALGSDYEPLPTGEALQAYWLNRLPPGEVAVLKAAIDAYPHSVAREDIDAATGYKRSSRDAYIQRLIARQLLEKGSGPVTASAVLFEG